MSREITIFEYVPSRRIELEDGRFTYNYSEATQLSEAAYWKAVDSVRTAYLGPWCPDCGKKGKKCRNRETCRLRSIVARPGPRYMSLPYIAGGKGIDRQRNAYENAPKRGDVREAVAA